MVCNNLNRRDALLEVCNPMLCSLYYEFEGSSINIVIQRSSFPYSKVKLNIWRPFYSRLHYETMLCLIEEGGEDYMTKTAHDKINNITKEEKDIKSLNDRRKKISKLCSTIQINKKDWKTLKRESL